MTHPETTPPLGLPLGDPEVVQVFGPVADTVVLNVKFFVAEWGESDPHNLAGKGAASVLTLRGLAEDQALGHRA